MAEVKMMDEQTKQILAQLPPAGWAELAQFLEFLAFKYHLFQDTAKSSVKVNPVEGSLTARYQGFVKSPLTVAELSAAYELSLVEDEE